MINTKHLDVMAAKEAQRFMGVFALPTVIFAALFFIGYILTILSMLSGVMPWTVGFFLGAVLTYASYTIMHDAAHGSICGKKKSLKWLNNGLGYISGQIIFMPFIAHQQEHLAHHRHTNVAGQDPDLYATRDSLWSLIRGTLIVGALQYKYYFQNCWRLAQTKDKIIVLLELIGMVGWRASFFIFGFWKLGLLILALNFAGGLILTTFFVWIAHRPYKQTERYKNTNTYIFPGRLDDVVSWLWLFQNYHSIHHLFPKVPFYSYRNLYRKIEPVMVERGAPIIRVLG